MGGAVSGALGAGMPMSRGAMGPGSYGSQNPVAMQTQQMARNPFGAAAGSSPFQPPMPARTGPQTMQAQLGQAPTPDDLYEDFQQRTGGIDQPQVQPMPTQPMPMGGMGGKSGGFGPAQAGTSPMMQFPPTARGPMPLPLASSARQQPQAMAANPNFQGGLRPAPMNYRAPTVNRQFISQGASGPLIQGFGQR